MFYFGFDPKKDLYEILSFPKNERQKKLKEYKENLKKYYLDIATLLKEIINKFMKNPDFEIGNYLKNNKIYNSLPEEIRDIFITRIYCYLLIKEKNKKLYENNKNNPNSLFFKFFRKTTFSNIDFRYKGGCLIFVFPDKESFLEVYKNEGSAGFYSSKDQFIVTYKQDGLENIIEHEMQHFVNNMVFNIPNIVQFNNQFLEDNLSLVGKYKILKIVDNLFKSHDENFFLLKDEILARIKGNDLSSYYGIKIYDFHPGYGAKITILNDINPKDLENKKSSIDIDIENLRYYFDVDENFQKQEEYVRTLLILFNKLKSRYPDNYLELLSTLDAKQLGRLVSLKNKLSYKKVDFYYKLFYKFYMNYKIISYIFFLYIIMNLVYFFSH